MPNFKHGVSAEQELTFMHKGAGVTERLTSIYYAFKYTTLEAIWGFLHNKAISFDY